MALIKTALGYGADFPGIYDWTPGEAILFISSHVQRERESLRTQALMNLTHAGTIGRLFSGNTRKESVMDIYSFLWTDEERQKAKVDRIRARLEKGADAWTNKKNM